MPEKKAITCSDATSSEMFSTKIVRLISSISAGSVVEVIMGGGGRPGSPPVEFCGKNCGNTPVPEVAAYALMVERRYRHSFSSGISSRSKGTTMIGLSMNTVFVRCCATPHCSVDSNLM